jgi:pimeloyl-ACP methyl ester carboxylesterase
MDEVKGLASCVAAARFRVLLHDRRNTGRSDLSLDGEGSEFEIWADDLYALTRALQLPPLIVGGSSSGCRLATIMALQHRAAISGLIMMRVTGGAFAVKRLSFLYYTQYIDAARNGGMSQVCETDHFRDLIAIYPARRDTIMGWDCDRFIAVFESWRASLEAGIADPMLGASEQALGRIEFPVWVMPGNDRTHSITAGRAVYRLIPGAELKELRTDQLDDDLISFVEWAAEGEIAKAIVEFGRRVSEA